MKKVSVLLFVLLLTPFVFAQKENQPKEPAPALDVKTADFAALAKAALAAHGGDKFKNLKTLIVRGTADVSGSPTQVLPATFAMVFAGEKYRFDIQAPPIFNFQQIYDGQQTYTSMRGISLPPLNRLGLPLLARMNEKDFSVSALPEKFKKKKGFRITSPEGYFTDFIIDEKTNLVKEYEASYDFNGTTATTSVAIDKYRAINGITFHEKFSQRLEMGSITSYADFKAKDILVDTEVADGVFSMTK